MANTYTLTDNKKLYQPDFNSYIDQWNEPVNTNFSGIDYALSGITYISVVGVVPVPSGTPITMQGNYDASAPYAPTGRGTASSPVTTSPSYIPYNIIIGGANLATGVLSANLNYQLPAGIKGQWSIWNNTTGSYTVTFSVAGGGSVIIEQGKRRCLVSDGVNISRADSPSDAQGTSTSLQFNDSGTFSGSALRYTKSTGNFTVGPIAFNGSIDSSGNLTTVGSQPLVGGTLTTGMVIKKASDGTQLGVVASGSGSSWVLNTGYTATVSVDMYAYPATSNADVSLIVNGYDNKYAAKIVGGKTSGQSLGIWTLAGSTAADYSILSQDKDGNGLFSVNGLGSVSITSRPSSAAWALNITKPTDTSGGGIACGGGAYTATTTLTYAQPILVDASKSNVFTVTLTGSGGGLSISNGQNGQTLNILIQQDGTGNRTINWTLNTVIKWPYGVAPTLSTAASAVDLLVISYVGTQWYGSLLNSFS